MKSINQSIKEKPWIGWVFFFVSLIIVFLIGLLASSIIERRAEAALAFKPLTDVDQFNSRSVDWGENFPSEYDSWLKTADTTFRSMFNSSSKDDMLEMNPRMVILWAGYAFSKEYNQPRGHIYAIDDIRNILRTGTPVKPGDGPQPGTCWTCKGPDVPRMINKLGSAEAFYKSKWGDLGPEIINPIGCADCHDSKTMNLAISRPALIEAFQRQGKDITKATNQEMRSLVCAQCHVEYYFKGDVKYLTFPWDKGPKVEEIEAYYDSIQFSDWTHSISKAPMLKAQHPDYEVYSMGVHSDRGIACADCHMPYHSEGGKKFTDHHIQSPLANIQNSCQVCHRESEEKLRENVYERQVKVKEIRDRAEDIIVLAHLEAKAAWDAGATNAEMKQALQYIRYAQWRWDFAAAGHGNAFHAPVELLRILGTSIDKAQMARLELSQILRKYNISWPIQLPDISDKAKAQKFIGLDMGKLNNEKNIWKKTYIPKWIDIAAKREAKQAK